MNKRKRTEVLTKDTPHKRLARIAGVIAGYNQKMRHQQLNTLPAIAVFEKISGYTKVRRNCTDKQEVLNYVQYFRLVGEATNRLQEIVNRRDTKVGQVKGFEVTVKGMYEMLRALVDSGRDIQWKWGNEYKDGSLGMTTEPITLYDDGTDQDFGLGEMVMWYTMVKGQQAEITIEALNPYYSSSDE